MYPWLLRELADIIVRPLSANLDQSWHLEEVQEGWMKVNEIPIYKKGKMEDLGN